MHAFPPFPQPSNLRSRPCMRTVLNAWVGGGGGAVFWTWSGEILSSLPNYLIRGDVIQFVPVVFEPLILVDVSQEMNNRSRVKKTIKEYVSEENNK